MVKYASQDNERGADMLRHPSAACGQSALFEYQPNCIPDCPGWCIGPTVFERRDGSLCMIFTGGPAGSNEASAVKLYRSISRNGGKTWEKAAEFLAMDGYGLFNPVSIITRAGTVLLFFNPYIYPHDETVWIMRSNDGGDTWSKPLKLDTGYSCGGTRVNPIQLKSGRIVLPYYGMQPPADYDFENHFSGCLISDDDGLTWEKSGVMCWGRDQGACEPAVCELANGNLYCLMRTREGYKLESWSQDGGVTWSQPRLSPFRSPSSCSILTRLKDGTLIHLLSNISSSDNLPRTFMDIAFSKDDGKTWQARRLHAADYLISNHSLIQLSDGTLLFAMASGNTIDVARFNTTWMETQAGETYLTPPTLSSLGARVTDVHTASDITEQILDAQPSDLLAYTTQAFNDSGNPVPGIGIKPVAIQTKDGWGAIEVQLPHAMTLEGFEMLLAASMVKPGKYTFWAEGSADGQTFSRLMDEKHMGGHYLPGYYRNIWASHAWPNGQNIKVLRINIKAGLNEPAIIALRVLPR
ncbi:MAG: glycoside hydrolase [Verrucomicrobia bacterium]|nr:glycoside hydrolase [Verrucomicrobiota bacterium]MBU4290596.1 glycoside hydrolase [Verrucomicrobiota bacterium]MBU4430203.1 glycoside hydrolase [Verrucomicrobiota bacterium]